MAGTRDTVMGRETLTESPPLLYKHISSITAAVYSQFEHSEDMLAPTGRSFVE